MELSGIRAHRYALQALARKHGVAEVQIFGSTARGETGPDSDLDLLVRLEAGRSLLDRAAFKVEVEELLGVSVDVANPDTLHPLIRERVQREAQPL
ncbi:nucleotidyltransferase family protein [Deinococcus koreensis]|uniref:Nucleotidyltransferase n=1 Tax=Deinococcus koreensis TaxID=2054903 RepID=A0A2K3UWY6_9DEIO|nr:nucleotidyltransferase family protein [Deinococcus koreensis]PNY81050.1 nucleotidyltransferase [Deinococcus koreensis]